MQGVSGTNSASGQHHQTNKSYRTVQTSGNYGNLEHAEQSHDVQHHPPGQLHLPIYQGPFNVNCTTNKEPGHVMGELFKSLNQNQVNFQKTSNYSVRCQKGPGLLFSVELNHLEDLANILIVKFKRLQGEMPTYREVSSQVLQAMTLV